VVSGRTFHCRAVKAGDYVNWIPVVDGDRPAFPPIILQERDGDVTLELTAVE
jgi:hypothetical protein